MIDLLNVSKLDWLFGAAKLTQNPDRNKCSYSGYGIVFDSHFGVGNGSLVNTNNKKKNILVLGEDPTQELDDTLITVKGKYSTKKFKKKIYFKSSW